MDKIETESDTLAYHVRVTIELPEYQRSIVGKLVLLSESEFSALKISLEAVAEGRVTLYRMITNTGNVYFGGEVLKKAIVHIDVDRLGGAE